MTGNSYDFGERIQDYEKDNEIKGAGNHYSFSDYGLDPRTGRRWNMDPISRHNMSSYLFGANNPIIFIDPDGTTEFYFNGKWIGTDGIDNNIIGVVTSKNVRKNIIKNTKEGNNFTGFLSDVKNGTKTNGVFYVNSDTTLRSQNLTDFEKITILKDIGIKFKVNVVLPNQIKSIDKGIKKLENEIQNFDGTSQELEIKQNVLNLGKSIKDALVKELKKMQKEISKGKNELKDKGSSKDKQKKPSKQKSAARFN